MDADKPRSIIMNRKYKKRRLTREELEKLPRSTKDQKMQVIEQFIRFYLEQTVFRKKFAFGNVDVHLSASPTMLKRDYPTVFDKIGYTFLLKGVKEILLNLEKEGFLCRVNKVDKYQFAYPEGVENRIKEGVKEGRKKWQVLDVYTYLVCDNEDNMISSRLGMPY